MIATKICRYLSRLDGVEVANTNESGSHYFNAPGVKIRVSDHIACSFNPTTTLNIVCDIKTDSFVVFYGSRIIPIKNYSQLKELLRNFVMVCDILAPLANIRNKPKIIEKIVEKKVEVVVEKTVERPVPTPTLDGVVSYVPAQNNSDWLYIGDLPTSRKTGAYNNVMNMKKIASHSKKKKK